MTNQELFLEKDRLKNKYEVIKNKISDLYNELDKMDRYYIKIENEINKRKI